MNAPAPLDFAPMMGPVARRLLGEPNRSLSNGRTLRWGTHGSLKVDLDPGAFHDKEANTGGGVLDLVMREQRCDKRGALDWMEREGFIESRADQRTQPAARTFYDYADSDGVIAYRVERRGKGHLPPFLQHGPDGRGGFHSGKGCMSGVPRLPYRLPELLAADRGEIVYIVEGEKDADRLASLGLVATTNSEGAGKFRTELAPHFVGRRVVIIPDNDKPGRDHGADVSGKLAGVAAAIATLELPGLPEKGDVSDWLAAGGKVADLQRLAEEALHQPLPMFPIADLTAWGCTPASPTPFYMAGHIPLGEVTLLTGAGGGNKSTFGQQLATCSAAGLPMLGIDVMQGPALYITAEDHDDRLHWVQDHICRALGVDMAALAGKLFLSSIRGRLNNELATFDADGRLQPREAFQLVRATIEATRARLLILDNVAHLFAGNENDRGQVTAFINLLYVLCRDLGVTILLIAHRNKAGDSYSGSTAWLNAVRSQLVIERPEDNPDPDARVLTIGKANYARPDQQLPFRWHDFALVRDEDLPADTRQELAAVIQANGENAAFLACLAIATRDRQAVSHNKGTNYAPTIFAAMPEAKGMASAGFERAMQRLRHIQQIRFDQELWRGPNRVLKHGIRLTSECTNPCTDPRTNPCTDPAPTPSDTEDGDCTDLHASTPLYPTGKRGAAIGAAAPLPKEDQPRRHGGMILAAGESPDDPVPGWEDRA